MEGETGFGTNNLAFRHLKWPRVSRLGQQTWNAQDELLSQLGGWKRIHGNCMSCICTSSFLFSNSISISLVIALHGKKVRNPLENLMVLPNGWENEVAQRAIWPYQMTSSWLI
jgi:hypothetical protein